MHHISRQHSESVSCHVKSSCRIGSHVLATYDDNFWLTLASDCLCTGMTDYDKEVHDAAWKIQKEGGNKDVDEAVKEGEKQGDEVNVLTHSFVLHPSHLKLHFV